MDNLEMAQNALQIAETVSPEHRDWWQCQANVYAAIAQAEQLKRIADVLESRKESAERFLKNPEDFLKDVD